MTFTLALIRAIAADTRDAARRIANQLLDTHLDERVCRLSNQLSRPEDDQ